MALGISLYLLQAFVFSIEVLNIVKNLYIIVTYVKYESYSQLCETRFLAFDKCCE